jgi:hypothetical protein
MTVPAGVERASSLLAVTTRVMLVDAASANSWGRSKASVLVRMISAATHRIDAVPGSDLSVRWDIVPSFV